MDAIIIIILLMVIGTLTYMLRAKNRLISSHRKTITEYKRARHGDG